MGHILCLFSSHYSSKAELLMVPLTDTARRRRDKRSSHERLMERGVRERTEEVKKWQNKKQGTDGKIAEKS